MVNYAVILYNVICYMIGYIRNVNVIADRRVVNISVVNAGRLGNAAVKGNSFVKFAELDFARKGRVFDMVGFEVGGHRYIFPIGALAILFFKLGDLLFG
jgi:hypothetical protein